MEFCFSALVHNMLNIEYCSCNSTSEAVLYIWLFSETNHVLFGNDSFVEESWMFCLQYVTDVKEIRVDKSNVSMETKKIVILEKEEILQQWA